MAILRTCCAALLALVSFGLAVPVALSQAAHEPPRGSAERAAILDAVRPEAAVYLGSPIEFVVRELSVSRDQAYAFLRAQRPGGVTIDIKNTPWGRGPYYSGPIDYPGIAALLRHRDGQWVVVEAIFSPADAPFAEPQHCRDWHDVLPEIYCQ